MSGKTFSGSYPDGIVLDSPGTENPATITGTVVKNNGDAVLGTSAAAWTVVNRGVIQNTGSSGNGIALEAGGTVTNEAGALIAGVAGVLIEGAAGAVTNFGTFNTGAGTGVHLTDGGSVVNGSSSALSALIGSGNTNGSGAGQAVDIAGGRGTVSNFGSLVSGYYQAVLLESGGKITNSGAVRSSHQAAVAVRAASGTVVNQGTIAAVGNGIGNTGISLAKGGVITNGSTSATSATISGYEGIAASGAATTVTNFGQISAIGFASGDFAVRFDAGGVLTNLGTIAANTANTVYFTHGGTVINGASGTTAATISGPLGLSITGAAGTVTNFGTIKVFGSGPGVTLARGGVVTNSGSITSLSGDAVSIGASATIGSTVTNTGVIGSFGGGIALRFANSHANTLTNSGTVSSVSGTSVVFGAGSDHLIVNPGAVFSGTVVGGAGINRIDFNKSGTVALNPTYVGFSDVHLAASAANSLTLTDTDFTGLPGSTITITDGSAGDTVDASALTAPHRVIVTGGAGKDVLTGGAGNDEFKFIISRLNATDVVKGGSGTDTLDMLSAGTIQAQGVTGVEQFVLADGGTNTLTLATANFSGVTSKTITVTGGDGVNKLSARGVSSSDLAVLKGGGGSDTLTAGLHTTMTGGLGFDQFVLTASGSSSTPADVTITDFKHGVDKLVFSDAGFNLGTDEGKGTATPQAIASSLFSSHDDGTFASTSNRFSYSASTGHLFYDADGSGSAHTRLLVTTLSGHPTLTASDIFFVA